MQKSHNNRLGSEQGMVWNIAPLDLELIKVFFSYKIINLKLLWIIHSFTKVRAEVHDLISVIPVTISLRDIFLTFLATKFKLSRPWHVMEKKLESFHNFCER